MNRIRAFAAVALLCLLSFGFLMGQDTPRASAADWEYRVILYTDWVDTTQEPKAELESLQSKLNQLGADGWELIKLDRVVVLKRIKGLR